MLFSITFRPSQLKVLSGLLTDIAAGLLLLTPTIKEIDVLTFDVILAILCLVLAVKTEDLLEEL